VRTSPYPDLAQATWESLAKTTRSRVAVAFGWPLLQVDLRIEALFLSRSRLSTSLSRQLSVYSHIKEAYFESTVNSHKDFIGPYSDRSICSFPSLCLLSSRDSISTFWFNRMRRGSQSEASTVKSVVRAPWSFVYEPELIRVYSPCCSRQGELSCINIDPSSTLVSSLYSLPSS
jgi:hypothetical protein